MVLVMRFPANMVYVAAREPIAIDRAPTGVFWWHCGVRQYLSNPDCRPTFVWWDGRLFYVVVDKKNKFILKRQPFAADDEQVQNYRLRLFVSKSHIAAPSCHFTLGSIANYSFVFLAAQDRMYFITYAERSVLYYLYDGNSCFMVPNSFGANALFMACGKHYVACDNELRELRADGSTPVCPLYINAPIRAVIPSEHGVTLYVKKVAHIIVFSYLMRLVLWPRTPEMLFDLDANGQIEAFVRLPAMSGMFTHTANAEKVIGNVHPRDPQRTDEFTYDGPWAHKSSGEAGFNDWSQLGFIDGYPAVRASGARLTPDDNGWVYYDNDSGPDPRLKTSNGEWDAFLSTAPKRVAQFCYAIVDRDLYTLAANEACCYGDYLQNRGPCENPLAVVPTIAGVVLLRRDGKNIMVESWDRRFEPFKLRSTCARRPLGFYNHTHALFIYFPRHAEIIFWE